MHVLPFGSHCHHTFWLNLDVADGNKCTYSLLACKLTSNIQEHIFWQKVISEFTSLWQADPHKSQRVSIYPKGHMCTCSLMADMKQAVMHLFPLVSGSYLHDEWLHPNHILRAHRPHTVSYQALANSFWAQVSLTPYGGQPSNGVTDRDVGDGCLQATLATLCI